jgi:toxin-antitoxin system PIN domain toxin
LIGVDTNILVYAHRVDAPWHDRASEVVATLAASINPWMIPWPCVHEFLSIVTRRGIFKTPTPMPLALRQLEYWMESDSLMLPSESERHMELLRKFIDSGQIVGAAVHDARVAAICAGAGASVLYSADRDFSRFPIIKVVNPRIAAQG